MSLDMKIAPQKFPNNFICLKAISSLSFSSSLAARIVEREDAERTTDMFNQICYNGLGFEFIETKEIKKVFHLSQILTNVKY